jgi:hypothetical protein
MTRQHCVTVVLYPDLCKHRLVTVRVCVCAPHLNLVASSWVCVEARSCSSVGSSLLGDAVETEPGPDAGRVVVGAGRGAAEAAGGAAGRAPIPASHI